MVKYKVGDLVVFKDNSMHVVGKIIAVNPITNEYHILWNGDLSRRGLAGCTTKLNNCKLTRLVYNVD